MNTRQKGAEWEDYAADYLTGHGMRIVERNFRSGRTGEIDLIGYHEGYLVFVEVKYRSSGSKGSALEAVGYAKQRQICRTADHYRYMHRIGVDSPVRYDVVAIQGDAVEWIPNAFPHIYTGNRR